MERGHQIAIMPARADEAADLAELDRRVINASYRTLLGEDLVDVFLASGEVERFLDEHIADCRVAEAGGEVVGLVVVEGSKVELLMVEAAWQGRGVGGALLAEAEAELFGKYGELELESFAVNDRANRFYRGRGWTESGRSLDEHGLEIINYKKRRAGG